jgi:Tol biopolymer transport system component
VEVSIYPTLTCPNGTSACGYEDGIVSFRGDGTGRRLLARHATYDAYDRYHEASWAPNGKRLAFMRGLRPAVMRADGSHLRLLRPTCCFYTLSWAPDGRRLLMSGSSTETSNDGIYEARAGGRTSRRLTHGHDIAPTASATGAIAFMREDRSGVYWVYVMFGRDATPRRLVRGGDPDWSPDGSRLAFSTDDGIYTISPSGGRSRRLANGREGTQPAWSPSGSRIAFVRDGNVYVVRKDGRRLHEIPPGDPFGTVARVSPTWQPRP